MAETNWYVVHTYSGYENAVKDDIEATIKSRELQDEICLLYTSDAADE